jgi:outer membrane protein OmpA-like peptidoglycan-associated protein
MLMMLATDVRAESGALGLRLEAVVSGKAKPAIVLEPAAALKKLSVTLTRDGAQKQVLRTGRLAVGKSKRLAFKSPVGVFDYSARFEVSWADGTTTDFTTTFKVTRVGKLELSIGPGDVDMEARRMVFRVTNPVAKAELVLLGERGRRIGIEEVDFANEPPGTPLELTWSAPSGGADIVRMDLKVTDIAGFWTGMQITPFSIEIPHDELEFASGKAQVRPEEAPKLQRTLGFVKDALAKHGTLLALKFYVAGYTDTVGSSGYNRELSNRRARSIAAWFRSHGLKIPIHYCGFGEAFLAVKTPDETDEPANRRAIYILTSQAPAGTPFASGKWKRL